MSQETATPTAPARSTRGRMVEQVRPSDRMSAEQRRVGVIPPPPPGWTMGTKDNALAALLQRLDGHDSSKGQSFYIKDGEPGVYRFVGVAQHQGKSSGFGAFESSITRFVLPGARVIAKVTPSSTKLANWSMDIEWTPEYQNRPLVREHKEMHFVTRSINTALIGFPENRQKRWSVEVVKRVVDAAYILEGLTENGEDVAFGAAATVLYALVSQAAVSREKGLTEKAVDLEFGKATLTKAYRLLNAYVVELEEAIQRGETGYDEDEPAQVSAPVAPPVPQKQKVEAWTPGESETDRIYRALEQYM